MLVPSSKKKKKRGRDEEFGEYVDPELRMALEASQQEARNESLLFELAKLCASKDKRILFVTGAGLSIASGIPAFRSGDDAVWSRHVTDMGTRKMLKKDTLRWFNEFWLPTFESERVRQAKPSEAHVAISKISRLAPLTRVVTQNVDGLHVGRIHGEDGVEDSQLIEAHGRARLYRCVGFWDSSSKDCCDEATATQEWYEVDELLPEDAAALNAPSPRFEGDDRLPTCPKCRSALVAPLALLFDECYDAHFFFEADSWDAWLDDSDAIVFVGTSYAVELTREALKRSKERKIPVFDINLVAPPPTVIRAEALRKNSIVGKAEILLPKLAILVEDLLSKESGVEIFSPPLSAHST